MHIPDGYLSPQTCAAAYAVAVPFWAIASRRVSAVVKTRDVPMLAMFAAVSFMVMMFNVPIPDGTTAHAVGAVVIAILLGPWAAVIAVSVALLFQALLFGDGGVLTFGANVVNMAVLMPFVGLAVYRLVAGRAPLTSRRRVVAAGLGGYVGISAAGLGTAVMLGLQPLLFHTADGQPLYAPYPLSLTIPAMALAHLTLAGAAEAILTVGVFAYLARAEPRRLLANHPGVPLTADDAAPAPARLLAPGRVALAFMAALVVLAPLGLLAPGGAFGEDDPADLDLGGLGLQAIPEGLARYYGFWQRTLLGDYGLPGGDHPVLAYWLSAVVGIAAIGLAVYALGLLATRFAGRRRSTPDSAGADADAAGPAHPGARG